MLTKEEGFIFLIFLSSAFWGTVFCKCTADLISWICFVLFFLSLSGGSNQHRLYPSGVVSTLVVISTCKACFLCVPLSEWDLIMIFYLKYNEERCDGSSPVTLMQYS